MIVQTHRYPELARQVAAHRAVRARIAEAGKRHNRAVVRQKQKLAIPKSRAAVIYPLPIGPVPVFGREITAARIIVDVAARHGIAVEDLKGSNRARKYSNPRQEAYYELRLHLNWSLPRIGRYVGGRDHRSALHGIRKHAKREGLPMPEGLSDG